jgi:hypothetical protein
VARGCRRQRIFVLRRHATLCCRHVLSVHVYELRAQLGSNRPLLR